MALEMPHQMISWQQGWEDGQKHLRNTRCRLCKGALRPIDPGAGTWNRMNQSRADILTTDVGPRNNLNNCNRFRPNATCGGLLLSMASSLARLLRPHPRPLRQSPFAAKDGKPQGASAYIPACGLNRYIKKQKKTKKTICIYIYIYIKNTPCAPTSSSKFAKLRPKFVLNTCNSSHNNGRKIGRKNDGGERDKRKKTRNAKLDVQE